MALFAAWWSLPHIAVDLTRSAPTFGWMIFRQVALNTGPVGWEVHMTPRDKKLAGFGEVVIRANTRIITGVEYTKPGWF